VTDREGGFSSASATKKGGEKRGRSFRRKKNKRGIGFRLQEVVREKEEETRNLRAAKGKKHEGGTCGQLPKREKRGLIEKSTP